MEKRTAGAIALLIALGAATGTAVSAVRSIVGAGNVAVLTSRLVPTGEATQSLAGASASYVLVTLTITNASTHDFTPDVSRLILTDNANARYQATASGSAVFIGISNSRKPLKAGEHGTYTVGFRVTDPAVTGTVGYEP